MSLTSYRAAPPRDTSLTQRPVERSADIGRGGAAVYPPERPLGRRIPAVLNLGGVTGGGLPGLRSPPDAT